MTLQQLKYIIQIVRYGSTAMAAQKLYITQQGTKSLSYARQVVEQAELLEQTHKYGEPAKRIFAVSSQHYAFVALVKNTNFRSVNCGQMILSKTSIHSVRGLGLIVCDEINRSFNSKCKCY